MNGFLVDLFGLKIATCIGSIRSNKQRIYHLQLCFCLGHVAYREDCGSPYITTLCKILSEHSEAKDLVSMLTLVGARMALEFQATSRDKKSYKQMPSFTSTLRHQVYFARRKNPGIHRSRKSKNKSLPDSPSKRKKTSRPRDEAESRPC